ncbi:unnamed protein product [Closterium sp. Yama58-4]|nr:unnamed protein product [Closterium sp. Yama58-4]
MALRWRRSISGRSSGAFATDWISRRSEELKPWKLPGSDGAPIALRRLEWLLARPPSSLVWRQLTISPPTGAFKSRFLEAGAFLVVIAASPAFAVCGASPARGRLAVARAGGHESADDSESLARVENGGGRRTATTPRPTGRGMTRCLQALLPALLPPLLPPLLPLLLPPLLPAVPPPLLPPLLPAPGTSPGAPPGVYPGASPGGSPRFRRFPVLRFSPPCDVPQEREKERALVRSRGCMARRRGVSAEFAGAWRSEATTLVIHPPHSP